MELKRIICILAYVLTLLSTEFVYADQTLDERDCTTVDISPQLGAVRNQGNIGWCYANVAADLLTFRHKNELGGKQASAGFVALTFNQFTLYLDPNEDAGYITPAVIFSEFAGICPQAFQDEALKKSPYKSIREQITALVELKKAYDEQRQKSNTPEFKELEVYRNSKSYINLLSDDQLIKLLEMSSVKTFPRNLAQSLCRPYMIRVKPVLNLRPQWYFTEGLKNFIPWVFSNGLNNVIPFIAEGRKKETIAALGRRDLMKEVHEEIGNKNFVAFSYNTRIFYDPKSEKYKKAGLHASGIVGRRWHNGQCELKLRNSWGASCASYTNPELKGKCDPKTGYVWVPDSIFLRTIHDVTYYRREKE
tara:strand:+ start:130936 stop:132024 length:1089 start_codon:yes stop_codon:yes gene_type:complete